MKINRNFCKIALLFLFFPAGFNEWNRLLFAADTLERPAGENKISSESQFNGSQGKKLPVSVQNTLRDSRGDMPDLSRGKEDGLPLYFPSEQNLLIPLAAWLKNKQDSEIEKLSFGPVTFISLGAKSQTFRGKVVQVTGRLLKTRFLPIVGDRNDNNPQIQTNISNNNTSTYYSSDNPSDKDSLAVRKINNSNRGIDGFYESWVLLDDNKEIPLRLWTLSIPDEKLLNIPEKVKQNQLYRRERINVTGIFYRLTSFFDGNDFRNSPMLIARDFVVLDKASQGAGATGSNPEGQPKRKAFPGTKIVVIVFLFLIWLAYRIRVRRKRSPNRTKTDTTICCLLICLSGFNMGAGAVWGDGEKNRLSEGNPPSVVSQIHLKGPSERTTIDSQESNTASTQWTDLPQDIPTMLSILARIQQKSKFWDGLPLERRDSFLRKRPVFPDINDQNDLRYPFWGKIEQVQKIPASNANHESGGRQFYYRCTVAVEDLQGKSKPIIIYTSYMPLFEINRLGRLAGEKTDIDNLSVGETVGGIGFLMLDESRRERCPVLCAAHLGWYPEDLLLGKLGMDVASFDSVPIYSPQEERKDEASVTPESRRRILSSLRLTKADTDAFYGLLLAGNRAGSERLFQEAKAYLTKKENPSPYWSVVELFNRPQQYQGELVLLRGHARRVERIPVGDEEVRKRFGIDSYYQIIFFTPDSQGNPLAVCVTRLPKGMPIGSGEGYREDIEIAAFFYKSWAWRTPGSLGKHTRSSPDSSETTVPAESEPEVQSWVKAPLLVGGTIRWLERSSSDSPTPPIPVHILFVGFFVLAFAYLLYRLKKS